MYIRYHCAQSKSEGFFLGDDTLFSRCNKFIISSSDETSLLCFPFQAKFRVTERHLLAWTPQADLSVSLVISMCCTGRQIASVQIRLMPLTHCLPSSFLWDLRPKFWFEFMKGSSKNFLWSSRLSLGRRKEPILGYAPKKGRKKIIRKWHAEFEIKTDILIQHKLQTTAFQLPFEHLYYTHDYY